MNIELRKII